MNRKRDSGDSMDMTPMVDVTFLLLIFFMVTASFRLHRTIEQLPDREDAPSPIASDVDPEVDTVVVIVDEYNTFQVLYGEQSYECPSEQELIRRLREVKGLHTVRKSPTELLVKAHGDCLHERVVMALDASTEVGMASTRVTLIETGIAS